jgi:hypothetical protein
VPLTHYISTSFNVLVYKQRATFLPSHKWQLVGLYINIEKVAPQVCTWGSVVMGWQEMRLWGDGLGVKL